MWLPGCFHFGQNCPLPHLLGWLLQVQQEEVTCSSDDPFSEIDINPLDCVIADVVAKSGH